MKRIVIKPVVLLTIFVLLALSCKSPQKCLNVEVPIENPVLAELSEDNVE